MEFEIKDLGKTKFCLGLQLEHLPTGIFVYQATYVEKILKKFNMDKSYPTKTPMVVRSLDVEKDPFRPREEGEEVLGPHVPYLSATGALRLTSPSCGGGVQTLTWRAGVRGGARWGRGGRARGRADAAGHAAEVSLRRNLG